MRAVTWAYEAFCVASVLTTGPATAFGGATGFVLHYIFFGLASIWLDWLLSPTMQRNLDKLAKNGYPTWAMYMLILFNLLGGGALIAGMEILFGCFEAPWRLDARLLFAVVCNLVLSELTFTVGHWLLHTSPRLAPFHMLHHLCSPASWSANLLSHPINLALEFSGPFASLAASHMLIWRDPFVLLVSLTAVHLWYSLNHSENMKLSHSRHHKYMESIYTVYTSVHFPPAGDLVRPLVRKAH